MAKQKVLLMNSETAKKSGDPSVGFHFIDGDYEFHFVTAYLTHDKKRVTNINFMKCAEKYVKVGISKQRIMAELVEKALLVYPYEKLPPRIRFTKDFGSGDVDKNNLTDSEKRVLGEFSDVE